MNKLAANSTTATITISISNTDEKTNPTSNEVDLFNSGISKDKGCEDSQAPFASSYSGWTEEGVQQVFHKSLMKQHGVIRFNCADSLDRTNIATFCMFPLFLA